MTVLEYLKTLNGIPGDVELLPEMIDMNGYVDIIPTFEEEKILGTSETIFNIADEILVAKRSFELTDGSALVEKRTSLYDDISLHCGKHANPEELIRKTIVGLLELQEHELLMQKRFNSELVDYQPRIDAFEQALISIAQNNNNSKK